MVHGSKGITPVISVILLLLLTISIVGFAMIFMQRSVESTSAETEQQLAKQTSSLGENFEVINVNGNQVTVRNKGTAELKNLAFYVDENKVTATGSAIPKDGIGTFSLDAAQLAQYQGKKLKVSSSGLTKEENADFYKANTVAYYTFDGTDGRAIRDESGNGNDGTFAGEAWNDGTLLDANPANADGNTPPKTATGKYGNALSFDGVDDYTDMTHNGPSLPEISGDKLTVEAWVKPGILSGTQNIITKNGPFILRLENDKLEGWIYAPWTTVTGNIPLSPNAWYHIAMVYDGSKISLYVDGKFDNSVPKTGALAGDGCVEIGRSNNGGCGGNPMYYFNGAIDEVRIYNKALSPQEIAEDMDSAYPINRPVASWSFESVSGNQVMDTHNVVAGRYGSAISFDGVDDYVYATDAGTGSAMDVDYITAEAWIKPSALTAAGNTIINKRFMGGAPRTWEMFIDVNGRLSWLISRDNTEWKETSSAGGAIVSGDWHHIIGTYDGSYGRLHINGVAMEPPVNVVGKLGKNNDETRIGKNYNGQYFNGVIDEVRILDKAIG